MRKNTSTIIWIVAVCLVLVAAYTFYSKYKPANPMQSPSQSTSDASSTQQASVMAPDFNLKDLEGNTVRLSDYRGKIVILNFWAVWCRYCIEEMPDLNELDKELKNGNDAVIIAVDSQESPETVKKYLTSNNITLNVVLDQDGSVTQTYGISGFPTTFIINRDGSVYTYIPGKTDKETLKEILDEVLNAEEPAQ